MKTSLKKYTGGVDMGDAVGAVAGVIGAGMLSPYIVKDTTTTQNKLFRLLASAGITVGLGFLAKKFMPTAAKSVVIGGLSITAANAIGMFTTLKLSQARPQPVKTPVNYPTRNYPNVGPTNLGQTTKPEFQGIPTL